MIYTSGVVKDFTRTETLEELQDNKLALVCTKLDLKPEDRLLDIGCGWGTLTAFAAKNYGCDATGITLARKQTAFGNQRIKDNGISHDKARILCMDYREIPGGPGQYTKIVSLEMAEVRSSLCLSCRNCTEVWSQHVGIRRYGAFLRQVYNLLDDDGIFVFQVAGIRPAWQYEDLIWSVPFTLFPPCSQRDSPHVLFFRGLFMNKYVFPGADASCSLGWVINQVESAGFEVKSVDVLGVHYSATIYRWYQNWVSNKDNVIAKYGERYVFAQLLYDER